MGSASASIVGKHRGRILEIACTSLCDLVEIEALHRIDFIKMDIEGSEIYAITESQRFFERFRSRIVVELHMVSGDSSLDTVRMLLEKFGYECRIAEKYGVSAQLLEARPRA